MPKKVTVKNVKFAPASQKSARISSCSCGTRRDNAVEGIQEAGEELSRFFGQLENPAAAERLVRAIRCRNKRGVEALLNPDCEVVTFFRQNRMACVRIKCTFGNCCDVVITFDICVSEGQCRNLVLGQQVSNRTQGSSRCCNRSH